MCYLGWFADCSVTPAESTFVEKGLRVSFPKRIFWNNLVVHQNKYFHCMYYFFLLNYFRKFEKQRSVRRCARYLLAMRFFRFLSNDPVRTVFILLCSRIWIRFYFFCMWLLIARYGSLQLPSFHNSSQLNRPINCDEDL